MPQVKPRGTRYTRRGYGQPVPADDRSLGPIAPQARFDFQEQLQISSTQALEIAPQEPQRDYLLIENIDSSIDIWVNFGRAAKVNEGVKIVAGGNYEREVSVPINSIWAIAESGTPNIMLHRGIGFK
jgi:hypothetical protein